MKTNKELAIIFKKVIDINKNIEFVPIKIVEGNYNQEEKYFIDKDGTPYYNIIENPDSYGYGYRDTILNYKKDHHNLSLTLIKILTLREIKKYSYTYNIDSETSAPIILFNSKKNEEQTLILADAEIEAFYEENYPEFYNTYLNKEVEPEENIDKSPKEINIEKIYQELTTNIIDQDEPIREILRIIWKQYLGAKNTSKSILIDGASGVGKSEIFKILSRKTNIPILTLSINNCISNSSKYKSIDHIIIELVKIAHFDIEKAQNGIIILDKIEELINSPFQFEILTEIESLLEGQNIIVSSNVGDFEFNTSNLMVIGLSSLQKQNKKTIGFNNHEKTDDTSKILEPFQTIIKMNELNHNSYIKILKSEKGILADNIIFLDNNGVKLSIEEPAIKELANKATKSIHGVKSLKKIIERTLSVAEFEIAQNPSLYSELIITPETISDNKKYTLVRKRGS